MLFELGPRNTRIPADTFRRFTQVEVDEEAQTGSLEPLPADNDGDAEAE